MVSWHRASQIDAMAVVDTSVRYAIFSSGPLTTFKAIFEFCFQSEGIEHENALAETLFPTALHSARSTYPVGFFLGVMFPLVRSN